MRLMILGFSMLICLILVTVIHTSVFQTGTRDKEMRQTLTSAMQKTVNTIMTDWKERNEEFVSMETADDFMSVFIPQFLVQINSDMKITFKVLEVDIKHGLFSIQVEGTYIEMDGKQTKKTVTERRDIILEQDVPITS